MTFVAGLFVAVQTVVGSQYLHATESTLPCILTELVCCDSNSYLAYSGSLQPEQESPWIANSSRY